MKNVLESINLTRLFTVCICLTELLIRIAIEMKNFFLFIDVIGIRVLLIKADDNEDDN